jgi:regulator of protease activity HflC (stomatin/prohibitin superfamily)
LLEYIPYVIVAVIVAVFLLKGLVTIRPTHVGAKETFGKYTGYKTSGLNYVIPLVQRLVTVNITEQLADVRRQDVITKENLNCQVDAQVYYQVGKEEAEMKKALYNVHNVQEQIIQLAKSTLRDVIGKNYFKDVNSKRDDLNKLIMKELTEQTKTWGIKILRVELKEIIPPDDVQDKMNLIIKAENEKDAEKDLKLRRITEAEGIKRSQILKAEGEKQRVILEADAKKESQEKIAQGEAKAITLVANANADKYKVEGKSLQENFIKTAIDFKTLETIKDAYGNNSKIIVTDPKTPLTLLVDDTYSKKLKFPYKSTTSESKVE